MLAEKVFNKYKKNMIEDTFYRSEHGHISFITKVEDKFIARMFYRSNLDEKLMSDMSSLVEIHGLTYTKHDTLEMAATALNGAIDCYRAIHEQVEL